MLRKLLVILLWVGTKWAGVWGHRASCAGFFSRELPAGPQIRHGSVPMSCALILV
jgi:hypothetical protein